MIESEGEEALAAFVLTNTATKHEQNAHHEANRRMTYLRTVWLVITAKPEPSRRSHEMNGR
jgi:hypothetical protein